MAKAVIMAGGQGERFWPLTKPGYPKYRIRFEENLSLIQKTYQRLLKVYKPQNIFVVTTASQAPIIRRELKSLRSSELLLEPFRNNTASAILFACAELTRRFGPETVVSFFPADHLIRDTAAFARTLRGCIGLARAQKALFTVGIKPDFASTAYGYIQTGSCVDRKRSAYQVRRFVEKPDIATARRYLKSGRFLWNGGIFTWRTGQFIEAMRLHSPRFFRAFDLRNLRRSYAGLPSISIDYALLEKAGNLVVVAAEMDWCDIGGWEMFYQKSPKDARGNLLRGLIVQRDSQGLVALNQTDRPLVCAGLSDIVVAATAEGLLVCRRELADSAALLSKQLTAAASKKTVIRRRVR
ncbi:MAG: sugar phosphate nucleotidyltransferase [Candidatus Omnitrophota bacterium]